MLTCMSILERCAPTHLQGVPFRETHHISGAAVKMAEDRSEPLSSLTPADLRTLHPAFDDDVAELWNYETSVERKNAAGGTAKSSVLAQIERVRGYLAAVEGSATD
jgi:argininosuccinate lyase